MARLMEGPKRLRRCTLQNPGATPPAGTGVRSIHRTAVYGPVCTVVWEGRSRETPPYPDCRNFGGAPAAVRQRDRKGCDAGKGMNPSRLGILTLGNDCASSTSFVAMIPFRWRMYAET